MPNQNISMVCNGQETPCIRETGMMLICYWESESNIEIFLKLHQLRHSIDDYPIL